MDLEVKNISLRLLCGENCKETEIPCAIEYLTENGSATLFGAVLKEGISSEIQNIHFLELEEQKWSCNVMKDEVEQVDVLWEDIKNIFEKSGIFLEQLKEDSKRVQQMIQKERKVIQ